MPESAALVNAVAVIPGVLADVSSGGQRPDPICSCRATGLTQAVGLRAFTRVVPNNVRAFLDATAPRSQTIREDPTLLRKARFEMPKKRLLVWGKTAPEFSKTYYETVCTGAVDVETGNLLRIYPITMRHHEKQFKKYTFIEAEIRRHANDPRPESFRIDQTSIEVGTTIGPEDGWVERSKFVLQTQNVFASVESLRAAQAASGTSLGLVAPKEIKRFFTRKKTADERSHWEEQRAAAASQREMFVDRASELKELTFTPIEYRVEFTCEDASCKGHDCSIRDWEPYVLSLKQFARRSGSGSQAERDVIKKLEQYTDPTKTRPYFFMGNTVSHPQSFMVVGFFHPPLELKRPTGRKVEKRAAADSGQTSLFELFKG